jgi:hypothetical protein
MKLQKYFKQIILENSRFSFLLDKYTQPTEQNGVESKPLMDLKTFLTIISTDPTTVKPENFDENDLSVENYAKIKLGIYCNWLLRNYVKPELGMDATDYEVGSPQYQNEVKKSQRLFLEDLSHIASELKDFDKYKKYFSENERNIDKYKPSELVDFMLNFQVPEKFKKKEEKTELRKLRKGFEHPGGKVDIITPNWTVIKITDKGETGKDAAMYYGGYRDLKSGESSWCTSEPHSSSNMFKTYIEKGPLYILLPNDDSGGVGARTGLPTERLQFSFPDNQFKDRSNKDIDLVNFLNGKGSELKEYFKPEFAKGLTTPNGKKVEIDYPGGSASKFVGLYGFDEFFGSLPKNITQFLFNNKSDTPLDLNIPDSIGQFTNLESLLLQNCVKTLPDSMSNLKKLNFLSLIDNKSLKSLPDSLVDLPELSIVFLKGTDVKLSDKFLSHFSEYIPGSKMYRKK